MPRARRRRPLRGTGALCLAAALALTSCAASERVGEARDADAVSAPGPGATTRNDEQLEGAVQKRLATLSGDYAVAVRELTGEERELSIRGGQAREPASAIKLFAAYAALDRVDAGSLDLDTAVRSGVSIGDCLRVLLVISDNNCHWELIDLLGEERLREQFAREGYPATRYPDGYGDDAANPAKTTSADDLVLLLARLHEGELLSADSSTLMLDLMAAQIYRQRAPSGVPVDAVVVDKPGLLAVEDGLVNTDAAIVSTDDGTYVIAVMGRGGTTNWAVAEITRTVHESLYGPVETVRAFPTLALEVARDTTRYARPGEEPLGVVAAGTRLGVLWSERLWVYVTENAALELDDPEAYWAHMDDLRSIYE
ncbi:MAG: serine hydrolase [Microcella pacifica]|uniref:serine hydrolase n=1 Tax=Microcella pacifica TaxID=2591847 RepID=UPI0033160772